MSTFYLGTHKPGWIFRPGPPLFLSYRQLRDVVNLRRGARRWCLDSGGFTELSIHGKWVTSDVEYAEAVARYDTEIKGMVWAAPQDWMCEPWLLERTGLTVREHQERTIVSYLTLQHLVPRVPFLPVLQGWTLDDYIAHLEMYADAGVDLTRHPITGLGSVCRRQATEQIGEIARELSGYGLRLHGFGVKVLGLARYHRYMTSADSMAWSTRARRIDPLPGHHHLHCNNCEIFANRWRAALLDRLPQEWHED